MILGKRYPCFRRWNVHVKRKRHIHDSLSLCALLFWASALNKRSPSLLVTPVMWLWQLHLFTNFAMYLLWTKNPALSTCVEFAQQQVKYRRWYLYFKRLLVMPIASLYTLPRTIHSSSNTRLLKANLYKADDMISLISPIWASMVEWLANVLSDTQTLSSFKNRLTFTSLVQYYSRFQYCSIQYNTVIKYVFIATCQGYCTSNMSHPRRERVSVCVCVCLPACLLVCVWDL